MFKNGMLPMKNQAGNSSAFYLMAVTGGPEGQLLPGVPRGRTVTLTDSLPTLPGLPIQDFTVSLPFPGLKGHGRWWLLTQAILTRSTNEKTKAQSDAVTCQRSHSFSEQSRTKTETRFTKSSASEPVFSPEPWGGETATLLAAFPCPSLSRRNHLTFQLVDP